MAVNNEVETMISEILHAAANEEFMRDFVAFLGYVTNNKIKLTPQLSRIPRKHVLEINKLFVHPLETEEHIAGKVFKFHEDNLARIFFMDLLMMASRITSFNRQNTLVKGSMYKQFISMDPVNKKRWLVLSWLFAFDFDIWLPYSSNFGEQFGAKRLEMIPIFQKWADAPGALIMKDTVTSLVDTLRLHWDAPNMSFERTGIELGLWWALFMPLQMMHLIEIKYSSGYSCGLQHAQEFSVTQNGRAIMREIVRTGTYMQRNETPKKGVFH